MKECIRVQASSVLMSCVSGPGVQGVSRGRCGLDIVCVLLLLCLSVILLVVAVCGSSLQSASTLMVLTVPVRRTSLPNTNTQLRTQPLLRSRHSRELTVGQMYRCTTVQVNLRVLHNLVRLAQMPVRLHQLRLLPLRRLCIDPVQISRER